MKLIKDQFWVKIEKPEEDTIKCGDLELVLNTTYNPMYHARRYGTVFVAPESTSIELDVKKGDKVWFHHFVPKEENIIKYIEEEDIYLAYVNQIYARERDGEVKSVHHWNFIEQLKESEDDIKTASGIYIKAEAEDILERGIVRYPSETLGAEVGEKVIFMKNSEYDMDINGEELLRMRDVDILAVYE
jgi:co-chaperonin GroES (HSP10)